MTYALLARKLGPRCPMILILTLRGLTPAVTTNYGPPPIDCLVKVSLQQLQFFCALNLGVGYTADHTFLQKQEKLLVESWTR
jgi:hypothetical protein